MVSGITGSLGLAFQGGVTSPDIRNTHDKEFHFDQMSFNQIISNSQRIQANTNDAIISLKNSPDKLGFKVGENLHSIQDLYSHSNFVELYAMTFPDQKDISQIPTLNQALSDPSFSKFADVLKTNLKTGTYPGTGEGSHRDMNHDVGAGSHYGLIPETRGKKVTWNSRAAEAVATKASKEYLNEVKKGVEKQW
jgi:hypothetical protein